MKINGPLPPSHSYVPTFDPPPRFSPFLPLGKTVATYREGVNMARNPLARFYIPLILPSGSTLRRWQNFLIKN